MLRDTCNSFYVSLLYIIFTGKMKGLLNHGHPLQESCLLWKELVPPPVLKKISWYAELVQSDTYSAWVVTDLAIRM